jgi:adenosylcobinamide amidohydrolase
MKRLFAFDCQPPWLVARFPARQRMLSWSLNRPGFVEAQTVAWLQVCDADLPLGVDPLDLLERKLGEQGLDDAVGLMTAREIRHHHFAASGDGSARAEVLVTLGLTNGITLDEIEQPIDYPATPSVGTINILVAVSQPLSQAAMLEAISVATMARTAALLSEGGQIIGTGTDCVVVACPDKIPGEAFAGLHTAIGMHITEAVYRGVLDARNLWAKH